jgi:hypothetical protein
VRIVASASTAGEIPTLADALSGATARLSDAMPTADGLRVPFDYIDRDSPHYSRDFTGFPKGSVPVMQAYLVVGSVASYEACGPDDAGAGDLSMDFDDAISLLTLSVSTQAALRIQVSAIDLSVVVTDDQVGERRLTMCM